MEVSLEINSLEGSMSVWKSVYLSGSQYVSLSRSQYVCLEVWKSLWMSRMLVFLEVCLSRSLKVSLEVSMYV